MMGKKKKKKSIVSWTVSVIHDVIYLVLCYSVHTKTKCCFGFLGVMRAFEASYGGD